MDSIHDAAKSDISFMDHLRELRKRLILALSFILVGSVLCYFIAPSLFAFLCYPYYRAFPANTIIGTGPAEAIILRINVSIFAGAITVSPLLFHQLWLFVAPGLHDTEKRLVIPFVALSSLLFLVGISFCYFIMLPLSMHFFVQQYIELGLSPQVRMSEHLSLVLHLLIAFGVIFEMPVLAYFLARAGVIHYESLLAWGRYGIVAIFVVSAILTPPDVVSQLAMAFPLLGLYGISLLIVRYAGADLKKNVQERRRAV